MERVEPSRRYGTCLSNHELAAAKIEEMKRMGYDHLAIADQNMAIKKGPRPSLDRVTSLKVWADVLPHVR
jgi:hypothetical protein